MRNLVVPFILIGLLAACGDAVGPEAQTASASSASNEPQVGERISDTETSNDLENSNRLAAAGAEANDAASRGFREIGWEELLPAGEEERRAQL